MFSLKQVSDYQPVPFDLGNGQQIYFRQYRDFTVQEIATWERVRRRVANLGKQREKADSQVKHQAITEQSQGACKEMIGLVLPDLSGEIVGGLPAGQLDNLAAICIQVASGSYARSKPDADDLETCRGLYPNLPEEFLDTLTKEQATILLGGDSGQGNG